MRYSPSTGGFYNSVIHPVIPDDSIELSGADYRQLLDGRCMGQIIVINEDGQPVLTDAPPGVPSEEASTAREREWRDGEVSSTEWLVTRHREQDMQQATTLSAEQFAELLSYRQALRDWPQSEQFPDALQRPLAPPWIVEQIQ